ncbi:hypothetical protein NVP1232O_58 [Vibrio phage 1.232.O._10N.261.51.E11]|nr:hypothetical protein NVP1232O_58 [Vibrio phage 1.232.O._10N.261.51.E11]
MNYEQDRKEFTVIMGTLAEIYEKTSTPAKTRIYFDALAAYTIEQVKTAVNKHVQDPKHGSFMPKPGDLVRHLTGNDLGAVEKAELAWMQVINSISTVGSYGTLKLEDKQALAAVKNMGSWVGLCQTKEADLQWKKKEFIELYKTLENTPIEMLPQNLPGLEDMHNQRVNGQNQLQNIREGLEKFKEKGNGLPILKD